VKPWHLGVLVGLGLLTKLSTLFLVGLVPVAMVLKWWLAKRKSRTRQDLSLRSLFVPLVAFALPALILGGIWSLHSVQVYGFPDVFGQRQHNLVVVGQPRTADQITAVGWGGYLRQGIETTFNSFWGQFGWMALPLSSWMYAVFLGLMAVGASGLILSMFTSPPRPYSARLNGRLRTSVGEQWRRAGWIVLGLTSILAVLAYLYYNTEFLQFQGRYMFSGILPFAIGMALGVDTWRRLILGRFSRSRWLTVGVFLLLAPLDVYLILRIIEPLLKP
jgi:hypothetical protein